MCVIQKGWEGYYMSYFQDLGVAITMPLKTHTQEELALVVRGYLRFENLGSKVNLLLV